MFVNYNSYDLYRWFIGLERIRVITVCVKLVHISSSVGDIQYGCVIVVVIIGMQTLADISITIVIATVLGALAGTCTVINLVTITAATATVTETVTTIISCASTSITTVTAATATATVTVTAILSI